MKCNTCGRLMIGENENGECVNLKSCPACCNEEDLDDFLQIKTICCRVEGKK